MTMKIKRLFAAVTSALVLVSGTAGMNICASDSEEEISGSTLENIDVYEELVIRVNNERAENGVEPIKLYPELCEAAGCDIPEDIITEDECVEALAKLFGGKAQQHIGGV